MVLAFKDIEVSNQLGFVSPPGGNKNGNTWQHEQPIHLWWINELNSFTAAHWRSLPIIPFLQTNFPLTCFLCCVCSTYPGYNELVFPEVCPEKYSKECSMVNEWGKSYSSGTLVGIHQASRDFAGSSFTACLLVPFPERPPLHRLSPGLVTSNLWTSTQTSPPWGTLPDWSLAPKHGHSYDLTSVGLFY